MATSINLDVTLRGPLLDGRDGPIVRKFIDDASEEVAEWGQKELKSRALHQPRKPKGQFSKSITVKQFGSGRTIIADYPQVLYGPWLEGTSARNASTRFKGYRLFQLTRQMMAKQLNVIVADRLSRAVDDLNGGG